MGAPVRVVAIMGHDVVLGVVRLACEAAPGLELIEQTDGIGGLEALVERDRPDVVVLDAEVAGALDAVRPLKEHGFVGRVLVLSDRSDGSSVLRALRVGADGYVVKAEGLRTVGSSILRVASGERVLTDALEESAVAELGRMAKRTREGLAVRTALTAREREIVILLAEGMTMRQIGRRLAISPRTVENHVGSLYRKLGVRTRVQAVARAAALGLVELD
jgi:DNA-binding NarL/FixJ family response regulator